MCDELNDFCELLGELFFFLARKQSIHLGIKNDGQINSEAKERHLKSNQRLYKIQRLYKGVNVEPREEVTYGS